jgi:hypothetical protein
VIGQIGRELPEPEHAIQAAIVLLLLLAFVGAPQGRASFPKVPRDDVVDRMQEFRQLAFTHVTVVDVLNGQIEPDMTVLIAGQEIREVGPSKTVHVPRQAHSIDARGKYLIPGLWDMHVHSLWDSKRPATFFPLFLANGVTGVREMGGPMPAVDQAHWRNQVATGVVLGPRLMVAGPFVDGPHPIWPGSIKVTPPMTERGPSILRFICLRQDAFGLDRVGSPYHRHDRHP